MSKVLDDPRIDWNLLRNYRFDKTIFSKLSEKIANKELSIDSAIFTGSIKPVDTVIEFNGQDREHQQLGIQALESGHVALFVLNGGMATRFGNVVKGTVTVYDDKSFLKLKAEDVAHACKQYKTDIPFVLMNSFATKEATEQHFEEHQHFGLSTEDIYMFEQSISLRMNPDGSLFIGEDDKPSYHSPGHGDFFSGLKSSGVLAQLRNRGCKYILFSNVDNLGATIEPAIIGQHIASGAGMSAELTQRQRNAAGQLDKGGAPAIADGRPQLLEGFRFPENFDRSLLPDFSTNNFIFTLEDIDRDLELPRHVVEKKVDGHTVLQLESITCEASGIYDEKGNAVLRTNYLRVPREGDRGRFFPVKSKADLEEMRPLLKSRLEAGQKIRALGLVKS